MAESETSTKSAAKEGNGRRKAKSGGKTTEVARHPFNAGAEVAIHDALASEVQRMEGRAPGGEQLGEATVADDGSLEISVEPGTYALSSQADEDGPYQYLVVTVKE